MANYPQRRSCALKSFGQKDRRTTHGQSISCIPLQTLFAGVQTYFMKSLCSICNMVVFLRFFNVRLWSALRGHSFFHPRHSSQWPPTSKDFYTRSCPLHYFLILILEKEPVFPFLMFSAKQVNYWYHFYNVFGMTRSLTGDWTRDLPHSKPALYH